MLIMGKMRITFLTGLDESFDCVLRIETITVADELHCGAVDASPVWVRRSWSVGWKGKISRQKEAVEYLPRLRSRKYDREYNCVEL